MSPTTHTRRTLLALCGGSPATPAVADCLDRETEYEQWRDGDRIVLDTYIDRWEGIAPGTIGGEIDPTLALLKNNEYELVWRNADGDVTFCPIDVHEGSDTSAPPSEAVVRLTR